VKAGQQTGQRCYRADVSEVEAATWANTERLFALTAVP